MSVTKYASLESFDEFKLLLFEARLVFFHVYEKTPDPNLLKHFDGSACNEILLMLETEKDKGFLAQTPIVVEITPPPREFISKPLIELRGLGAWAKGALFDFEPLPAKYHDLILKSRAFAFRE